MFLSQQGSRVDIKTCADNILNSFHPRICRVLVIELGFSDNTVQIATINNCYIKHKMPKRSSFSDILFQIILMFLQLLEGEIRDENFETSEDR